MIANYESRTYQSFTPIPPISHEENAKTTCYEATPFFTKLKNGINNFLHSLPLWDIQGSNHVSLV